MKYKVLVTDPISDSGIKILENHNCEVINRIDTKDTIDNIIDQIDAWIIRSGTQISEDYINKAKKYKLLVELELVQIISILRQQLKMVL